MNEDGVDIDAAHGQRNGAVVTAAVLGEQSRLAHAIADRNAIADIETDGDKTYLQGDPRRWYDVRPMLDPNERPGEFIDMATDALAYARLRGLIAYHPKHAHLVRITRQP